jgi:hypothetical protein
MISRVSQSWEHLPEQRVKVLGTENCEAIFQILHFAKTPIWRLNSQQQSAITRIPASLNL